MVSSGSRRLRLCRADLSIPRKASSLDAGVGVVEPETVKAGDAGDDGCDIFLLLCIFTTPGLS